MAEHTRVSAAPVLLVARYRLHLRADTEVRLPGYAGSTWRGVLGHALKRTVCVTGVKHCPDCLLYRSCVFPYLYDTPPPGADAREVPDQHHGSVRTATLKKKGLRRHGH